MKFGVKLVLSALLCVATAPAQALDVNTPYLKVADNFYIGTYCHISTGKTQGLLKAALGLGRMTGIPADLLGFGFDKITMSKGDVVCFWLHVNHEKRDMIRKENRTSRRHIIDTKSSELTAQTANFTINVFGSDKKKVGDKSGTCSNHRHCSSNIIKPSAAAAGLAMCIEPVLSSGKKISIVIAQGNVPVANTTGKLADTACDARKAEYGI